MCFEQAPDEPGGSKHVTLQNAKQILRGHQSHNANITTILAGNLFLLSNNFLAYRFYEIGPCRIPHQRCCNAFSEKLNFLPLLGGTASLTVIDAH